ncbi:MAG: YceI family protein [Pontixanthobacter sp.]
MRTAITLFSAAALAAIAVPTFGQYSPLPGVVDVSRVAAGTYVTDPAHTLVAWEVDHFGFNDYFGLFGNAEGTLTIDPADPSAASVDVSLPIASLAVVSEGLREHMLRPGKDGAKPDFFGADPGMARFVSTGVDVGRDGVSAMIRGNLTMNGMTRPVMIDTRFTGAGANPRSEVQTIGFEGTTTISRSAFGIDYAVPMVSDEVELTISVAFEKE